MKNLFRSFKLISKVNGRLFLFVSILSFLSAVLAAAVTLAIKPFFDLVESQARAGSLTIAGTNFYWIAGTFIALYVLETWVNIADGHYTRKWRVSTRNKIVEITFRHFEALSLHYFETNSTGKIKERVDRGVMDMLNIIESIILDIAPQLVFIVIALYFLFKISPVFGSALLVGIIIFTLIAKYYGKVIVGYQKDVRKFEERASGKVIEAIINVKTIKSFSRENYHLKNFRELLSKSFSNTMARSRILFKMGLMRGAVSDSVSILVLCLGTYWTVTGKITVGTLILAWSYTNRSIGPLWFLTRQLDEIQANLVSVGLVFDLLDTKPDVADSAEAISPRKIRSNIEFNNVVFTYGDKKVLDGLNLKIPHGKTVAIIGKSGAGKSTLVKLLLRFYDTTRGEITLGGKNIKQLTQRSLRSFVGAVMQDGVLFDDTAEANIGYGKIGAKRSEIIAAAKAANAHDFIMKLPDGYKTIVGERGVKLSGGEQQRINIARAILKNPPILVLDEATSSLDSESEQLIQTALWKLIEGRTTIIIAHRLSTVMKADLIVVMDKGKITEMGTHGDLVKQRGIYAKLFEIQSGGYLK